MMIDSVKKAMEGGTEIKKERGVGREKQEKERVSEEDKDKDKEGDRGRKIEGSERKKTIDYLTAIRPIFNDRQSWRRRKTEHGEKEDERRDRTASLNQNLQGLCEQSIKH